MSADGVAADTAVNDGGASLTWTGDGFRLLVPTLNVNETFTGNSYIVESLGLYDVALDVTRQAYSFAGFWASEGSNFSTISAFISGYRTENSAIPAVGSAIYVGAGNVAGVVHRLEASRYYIAGVFGNASFIVDFGTNSISGLFTDMIVYDRNTSTSPWNTVSVTASIVGPGRFSGTTAVTDTPDGAFVVSNAASGFIEGKFYGPTASELSSVWSIYDGTTAVTGLAVAEGGLIPTNSAVLTNEIRRFLETTPHGGWRNTGEHPTVAAPARATEGTSPAASLIASAGGPTLDGSGPQPASGTAFPLTQTVMAISPTAAAADSATNNGGATLTLTSTPSTIVDATLNIPSLGISQHLTLNGSLGSFSYGGTFGYDTVEMATKGLQYTTFGAWTVGVGSTGATRAHGAFVTGYETPAAAMPVSGTAIYNGQVMGTVLLPASTGATAGIVSGDVSLTADFAAGGIAGQFSNMKAYDNGPSGTITDAVTSPWNDVSVSASIAAGTSKFSGTVAASSAPAAPYALKPGATGFIDGGFYGPSGENIGAVWSLSNGDGTGSAIGVLGATKQ